MIFRFSASNVFVPLANDARYERSRSFLKLHPVPICLVPTVSAHAHAALAIVYLCHKVSSLYYHTIMTLRTLFYQSSISSPQKEFEYRQSEDA